MTEPKKLYRNTNNKMIAGVCAGIADYFTIDVTIVRLGVIILTFCGGAGIVGYLAAWVLVPEAPQLTP